MHFSAALTTLSAFALMSTTMAVPRSASFVTWGDNRTCNGEDRLTHRYGELDDTQPCMLLPDALAGSIKVVYTRDAANCRGESATVYVLRIASTMLTMDVQSTLTPERSVTVSVHSTSMSRTLNPAFLLPRSVATTSLARLLHLFDRGSER